MNESKAKERDEEEDIMASVTEYILTQYNLKQGFEKFGKKAEEATEKEISTDSQHGCIVTIGCN